MAREVEDPGEVRQRQRRKVGGKPAQNQQGDSSVSQAHVSENVGMQTGTNASEHARMHAYVDGSTQGNTPAQTQESIRVESEETNEESTDARMHARTQEGTPADVQVSVPTRKQANQRTRTPAGKDASKDASKKTYMQGFDMEKIYDQISRRRHLSNNSFRYRSEEIEDFDAIFEELSAQKPGRVSKNDMARLALIMLCKDYRENNEESVLAQVFKRM